MTHPSETPQDPPQSRLDAAGAHAARAWRRAERYAASKLVWNSVYRATSYLKSALWVIPFFAILLVLAIAPMLRILDAWLAWRVTGLGTAGAQSLYQTVITLTLSFIVFTFGSLLVAIQVASGQLTPRIIATTLLRNNVVRYSVGLFVFTLVFAVMALNRLEASVHEITAFLTAGLGIVCMATFLFLIDYAARLLRPVSILAHVGNEGLVVIKSVYPRLTGDAPDVAVKPKPPSAPQRIVHHNGHSGIVLAVDLVTLLREAKWADGVVEFVPQVGDFVASDEPLFILYGGGAAIKDRVLQAAVAFGSERTMEQDPLFSFRIMADIALKALSPAINDPTTAVLAIDQIQRLLRVVGRRQLRGETIDDERGRCRVIYRTPNWEDFVHLTCTEIRACGAGNVQIARRLRAMLDNLVASLPAHRHQALLEERERLDIALEPHYPIPADLALARIPDSQGLGGSSQRSADTKDRPARAS
jgi:uncharacterized membrane protein